MMDNVALSLDAMSRLSNIINKSNDNQWKNGIINDMKINVDSNDTMNVAMIALKNQINDNTLVDMISNLDAISNSSNGAVHTIAKSQLDFESVLYCQMVNSKTINVNTNQMFITHLKHLVDDIRSSNSTLRAINMFRIINNEANYQRKESGLVIIECIESILKFRNRKQDNAISAFSELVSSCLDSCSIITSKLYNYNDNNDNNNKINKIFNKIIPLLLQLAEDRSPTVDINMQKNAIISLLYCTNNSTNSNSNNATKCHEIICSFLNRLNIVASDLSRRPLDPKVPCKEMQVVIDIFNAISIIGGYSNTNTTATDPYNTAWIENRALLLLKSVYQKKVTSLLFVVNLLYCSKINPALAKEYYTSIIRALRVGVTLFGLKGCMYQQVIESIVNWFHSGANATTTDLDFLSMVFSATLDDLSGHSRNINNNDFSSLLLEHLNSISNSNITIPLITKLMIINGDTTTNHYLLRILTDSVDALLLNNTNTSVMYNRMEGAARGLMILINDNGSNADDASITDAFLTLCHKLNYANTNSDNTIMNDAIGLALGLLLQPIATLLKRAKTSTDTRAYDIGLRTNPFTSPTLFFFLSLVLKKYETLWEQRGTSLSILLLMSILMLLLLLVGWIDYSYDIIINSKMLNKNNTDDSIILKSLSSSLLLSLKSLKLKLSSSLKSAAINNDNVFIITISIIESIRVAISLDVTTVIGYSNHKDISGNDSCQEGYLSLLDPLLSSWLDDVAKTMAGLNDGSKDDNTKVKWTKRSLKERIANCFNLLISSLSLRAKSIRDVCSKYIIIIMDKFPWLLLSTGSASSSLFMLLDLLGPLSEKYNTYIVESNNYRIIHEINDGDDNDHHIPRTKSDVSDNVNTILIIAYRWMTIGMHKMPSVISLIMQNYVIRTTKLLSSSSSSAFEHLGILLSKEMMLSQKPSYAVSQSIEKTSLSRVRAKASRRSLSGLMLPSPQPLRAAFSNAYPIKMTKYNISRDDELIAVLLKSSAFLKQCTKIYNDYSIGINIIIDNIWALVAAIMRLSDLDINANDISMYCLEYVQVSSLVVITNSCSEITSTVIDSWRWLLSGWQTKLVNVGPNHFLHEAFHIFKCFLTKPIENNTEISTVVDFIDDYSVVINNDEHIAVLENVIDIFQSRNTDTHYSDEIQLSFLRLIVAAFRTLPQITSSSSQQVLREKILISIVIWFEESSSSALSSTSLAIDSYLTLSKILEYLIADFSVWSTNGHHAQGSSFGLVESISFMKQSVNSNTSAYDPLVLTYKESLVAVYMKGKDTNYVNACCQPTGFGKTTPFKFRLNILMRSLVLRKMNFIAAWNIRNPFFKPYQSLVRRCSKEYDNLINAKNYKAIISTAWTLSPTLAVQLATQLSHLDRQDVYSSSRPASNLFLFFQCDLSEVIKMGESVSIYLQNDNHVQSLALDYEDMLKALLTWQQAPLHVTIDLLNRCNSLGGTKSSTVQFFSCFFRYVIRSLRAADIDSLMFVIPQLVQLLRRDDFGCISDFLLVLSKRSFLFCHKLIWYLRYEQFQDQKKMYGYCNSIVGYDPLPQLASMLLTRIMSSLSISEKKYVREELTFFTAMTSISSKLKICRKNKSLHQQLILDEVQKIPLYPNLRLPTNYNKIVVNVDINSGKPMTSAKKCPFLLVFQTRQSYVKGNITIHYITSIKIILPSTVNDSKCSLFLSSSSLPLPSQSSPKLLSYQGSSALDPTCSEDEVEVKNDGQLGSRPILSITTTFEKDNDSDATDDGSESPTTLNNVIDKVMEKLNRSSRTPSPYPTHDSQKDTDAVIFKTHDDCRQDALTIQIISKLKEVFKKKELDLYLCPYEIMPVRIGDHPGGILQVIPNAQSRHQIGKNKLTLMSHYISTYGPVNSVGFRSAQQEFVRSLAGYAVACYLLSIKDRHNGNIVIDGSGHIIHIDYGFILGISPGSNLGFENAAFKLTNEMIALMGGTDSPEYKKFVDLAVRGFLASREIMDDILALVCAHADSGMECMMFKDNTLSEFRRRFFPNLSPLDAASNYLRLLNQATTSFTTSGYDCIQNCTNGIAY